MLRGVTTPPAAGPAAGVEAAPPPKRGSRGPYVVLGLIVLVLLGVQTLNRQWSTDYWMYTATVDALLEDAGDPPHDMTGSDDPSERFTPYTVALAAVVRETGLASVTVMQLAAIANLVLFLVAFELFVTELIGRRLVAVFALIATLVMWGIGPWRWSGYLNLNSIGFGMPWPSMFATGLVLLVGWALLRYDRGGAPGWLVLVGVGVPAALLSHPYTGGWGIVMLLALAVHRRLYRRDRVVPLLIATACGVVLLAAWPYYPFFELGRADSAYSFAMQVMYRNVPLRLAAALPGFVVVVARFRRDRTDPLALMLFGGVALYGFGWVTDTPSFGRVLPLIMLAVHIGIGILVADLVERRRRAGAPLVAWLVACVAIGLVGAGPGLLRTVPRGLLPESLRDKTSLRPITDQYTELEGALPAGSVVIAETYEGLSAIVPAFGMSVVAPGYPSAFVDDVDQRNRDVSEFVDASTTDEARRRIAERYDAEAVLCVSDECLREFGTGDVIAQGSSWTLLRLPAF